MSDFRSMQDMFNGTVNGPVNRQPTPLFLADALNADARSPEIKLQAASELRRLYGLCIQLEEELNAKSQRKPLTDEQILNLVPGLQDCLCDPWDYNNSGDYYASIPKDMIRLARAVEAHYGIKEKNNG